MRCTILLIAIMASPGLMAPAAGTPAGLSPAVKRTMGDRGLHYADISADDDAILYRWRTAQGNVEPENETDSDEIAEEVQY